MSLNEDDLKDLARLHSACVGDSLVTELGVNYARCFYRYLDRSPLEYVWIRRDADGKIIAASVFTLQPHTLGRRLLLHTPLPWYLFLGAFSMVPLAFRLMMQKAGSREKPPELDLPEWILLFTTPTQRGGGLGASLIQEMEDQLRALGIKKYQVRTNADPANKALAFHIKHGAIPCHLSVDRGRLNQVYTKIVPG